MDQFEAFFVQRHGLVDRKVGLLQARQHVLKLKVKGGVIGFG